MKVMREERERLAPYQVIDMLMQTFSAIDELTQESSKLLWIAMSYEMKCEN